MSINIDGDIILFLIKLELFDKRISYFLLYNFLKTYLEQVTVYFESSFSFIEYY